MSSDLFVDDGSFYRHSYEADLQLFSNEPFSPFSDSAIDILQAFSDHQSQSQHSPPNPVEHHSNLLDQTSPNLFSSSPPSYQLGSLSLYQATQLSSPLQMNDPNLGNVLTNFSAVDNFELKTEQCHVGFDQNAYGYNTQQAFAPHSYGGGAENVTKFMQRSFSSHSFDGKPSFIYQPQFDSLMETPSFQNQAASLSSPETNFLASHMTDIRRVSSTGDLQSFTTARNPRESSPMEEAGNFKMCRYSAEERKEKISRYRAKRSQRNFNKTIKYACRKTLADNRPRIRGRFARNDETNEILKPACSTREEDEDDLWIEGWNVEEELEDATVRGGQQFMNNKSGANQISSSTSATINDQLPKSFFQKEIFF